MFWVIFDTATKLDYYRDVHNLLALPPGGFICYDYRPQHISDQAVAQANSYSDGQQKALIVYAQPTTYQKGGPSPSGADPLPFEATLWVPTRLASLQSVTRRGDRYYLDLKLDKYPSQSNESFSSIIRSLHREGGVPFNKWIAISDLDPDLMSLGDGDAHDNWTRLVDLLGNPPSQFAGDSFWRISEIASGDVDRVQLARKIHR